VLMISSVLPVSPAERSGLGSNMISRPICCSPSEEVEEEEEEEEEREILSGGSTISVQSSKILK
jgi:hypothetical protein